MSRKHVKASKSMKGSFLIIKMWGNALYPYQAFWDFVSLPLLCFIDRISTYNSQSVLAYLEAGFLCSLSWKNLWEIPVVCLNHFHAAFSIGGHCKNYSTLRELAGISFSIMADLLAHRIVSQLYWSLGCWFLVQIYQQDQNGLYVWAVMRTSAIWEQWPLFCFHFLLMGLWFHSLKKLTS